MKKILRNVVGSSVTLIVSAVAMVLSVFMIAGCFLSQNLGATILIGSFMLFLLHVELANCDTYQVRTNQRDEFPQLLHSWFF